MVTYCNDGWITEGSTKNIEDVEIKLKSSGTNPNIQITVFRKYYLYTFIGIGDKCKVSNPYDASEYFIIEFLNYRDLNDCQFEVCHTYTEDPNKVVIDVIVEDQNGDRVILSNVTIPGALGETNIYTNLSGIADGFILEKDKSYVATASPPNGYETNSDSSYSFIADTNNIILSLTKDAGAIEVLIDVIVEDQNGDRVIGSNVNIPDALGAETITTNMSGVAVGFTLEQTKSYIATASPPNGYKLNSDSSYSFTVISGGSVILSLTKDAGSDTVKIITYGVISTGVAYALSKKYNT